MKNYTISIQQVSKARNRYFSILVDGEHIAEISSNKPYFGTDYGKDEFVNVVKENAYQAARRVIIHSFNNDVDVFATGEAKMEFQNIKWA